MVRFLNALISEISFELKKEGPEIMGGMELSSRGNSMPNDLQSWWNILCLLRKFKLFSND